MCSVESGSERYLIEGGSPGWLVRPGDSQRHRWAAEEDLTFAAAVASNAASMSFRLADGAVVTVSRKWVCFVDAAGKRTWE